MSVRKINESTLTAIGNAIRAKTGGSALIYPENMASEIESIPTQPVVAPRLPGEYQEVEYIGSRTNASLSVPLPAFTAPLYVEIKAQIQHQNSNTEDVAVIIGSKYYCPFFYSYTQTTAGSWCENNTCIITDIVSRNESALTMRSLYYGGSLISIANKQGFSKTSYSGAPPGGTAASTMVLFGSYTDTRKFYGDIYSVKVSTAGGLKCDLVPCYRKADGVIGMYDLVSESFYTSTTSETFIKGADVN